MIRPKKIKGKKDTGSQDGDNGNILPPKGSISSLASLQVGSRGEVSDATITPSMGQPDEMPNGDEPPSRLGAQTEIQTHFISAADAKAIGKTLTRAREEAGMTKAAVAKSMGTVTKSIIRLENGEQNPTLQTLNRFSEALGYSLNLSLTKNSPENK